MAHLVGEHGKVVCIDLQEVTIENLIKRAKSAGLDKQMKIRSCSQDSLRIDDIREEMDFALAFAVVHEVSNRGVLFKEIFNALKPGGKLLVAEPMGHVGQKHFEDSISLAQKEGFSIVQRPKIERSYSVLLSKTF